MVVYNVLTPLFRDGNVFVLYMVARMLHHAINVSILGRQINSSIARESRHSAGISTFLALFRL